MKEQIIHILDTIQLKGNMLLDSIREVIIDEPSEPSEDLEDNVDPMAEHCECSSCSCNPPEKKYGVEFNGKRNYQCFITGTYEPEDPIFKEIMEAVKREIFCEELENILKAPIIDNDKIYLISDLWIKTQNDDNFKLYEVE